MKLLLVEPSILLRERLAAMLASLGCVELTQAAAVEEVAHMILAIQPEVVIVDACLPDEGGLGVLLRARLDCRSACLVVVSAHFAEPYRKRWLQAGADHVFDLSTQVDLLLKMVRHQCRTHSCSIPRHEYQ